MPPAVGLLFVQTLNLIRSPVNVGFELTAASPGQFGMDVHMPLMNLASPMSVWMGWVALAMTLTNL